MFDKRARDILIGAFWKSGWHTTEVAPTDLEYAKSRGYMFEPVCFSHDQLVDKLLEERALASQHAVSEAFLASLSTRRVEWRSALGSFAFARNFPNHRLADSPSSVSQWTGAVHCAICGTYDTPGGEAEDLNVLSFEKHKWGGVRRDNSLYAWFDLMTTRLTPAGNPTAQDTVLLRDILAVARSQAPTASVSVLVKALKDVFPSSMEERRMLVEILAMCGILQPRDRPGYWDRFTPWNLRSRPSDAKNDWNYPAIWWTGRDGVNDDAVAEFFPGL